MDIVSARASIGWKRHQIRELLERVDTYELVETMLDLLVILNLKAHKAKDCIELLEKTLRGDADV